MVEDEAAVLPCFLLFGFLVGVEDAEGLFVLAVILRGELAVVVVGVVDSVVVGWVEPTASS